MVMVNGLEPWPKKNDHRFMVRSIKRAGHAIDAAA